MMDILFWIIIGLPPAVALIACIAIISQTLRAREDFNAAASAGASAQQDALDAVLMAHAEIEYEHHRWANAQTEFQANQTEHNEALSKALDRLIADRVESPVRGASRDNEIPEDGNTFVVQRIFKEKRPA